MAASAAVLGDFVEFDSLGVFELEDLRQMPRDRFAFAIGVGREVDLAGRFRRRLELLDDVALAFDRQVFGRKIVVDVDAERRLRQVADVPDRRLHDEARRQELLDGFGFRRRFDDDEWFRHADPREVNAYSIDGHVKPGEAQSPPRRTFNARWVGRVAQIANSL